MKNNSTTKRRLEDAKIKLNNIISNSESLLDPDVIKVSQELDEIIVEFTKENVSA